MGRLPNQGDLGKVGGLGERSKPALPIIETFTLGPYATNCYLVRTPSANGCWLVDVGFEPQEMLARVPELRLTPRAIVLTHAHLDHIAGVREALELFPGTPILIHEAEQAWLGNADLNLSSFAGMPVTTPPADRLLKDGETLELEGSSWRVLHTPGHSPGGIALYNQPTGAAIVGDALFAGSIGRTDFPGCSLDVLARSIRAKLYTLPEATTIYPGHGPTSTIGREKRSNPFVPGA